MLFGTVAAAIAPALPTGMEAPVAVRSIVLPQAVMRLAGFDFPPIHPNCKSVIDSRLMEAWDTFTLKPTHVLFIGTEPELDAFADRINEAAP